MYERVHVGWDAYHHRCQTGPCFACEILAGNPDFPHPLIYEDKEGKP